MVTKMSCFPILLAALFLGSISCLNAQEQLEIPSDGANQGDKKTSHKHVPYMSQHDVYQFIEKIRQKGFAIYNDTRAEVKVKFVGFKDGHEFKTSVKVQSQKEFSVDKEGLYSQVLFKTSHTNLFLNLEKIQEFYRVTINYHPATPYLQLFHFDGDFTPKFLQYDPSSAKAPNLIPYGPQYLVDPPTNLEAKFIEQYDGHLRYLLNVQFPGEQINPKEFFARLNEAYKRYSLEEQVEDLCLTHGDRNPKISPITHTIWLTSAQKPVEFPDEYIYWLKKSVEACPVSEGFKHWFWVEDKKKLPKTINALQGTNIEIRETRELGDFPLKEFYELELAKKRFGRASDIIRIVLLKIFGGIYKDTDYRIHQSFLSLVTYYNFFSCREPMSSFIGNAIIGASPDHPVINEYLALLERNYKGIETPKYIRLIPDQDGFKTILMTGPGVLTTAVARGLGAGGGADIIFPHEILFPTPLDNYPQIKVVKPNMPVPPAGMGVHYWETSWARPQDFGSIG